MYVWEGSQGAIFANSSTKLPKSMVYRSFLRERERAEGLRLNHTAAPCPFCLRAEEVNDLDYSAFSAISALPDFLAMALSSQSLPSAKRETM